MSMLREYEHNSGQLINGDKSHFMLCSNAFNSTSDRIKRLTSFKQKQGPISYLGCSLFVGSPRNIYFPDLLNNIVGRITDWKTKKLSYGGKAVLTKHLLPSLPIQMLMDDFFL